MGYEWHGSPIEHGTVRDRGGARQLHRGRAHGLSQPMVGKHIASLEQRLGGRLLARTTRRQQLTELGRHYFQRCQSILAEIRAAESGAELMSGARGVLRINASVTFGSLRLAGLLAEFMQAYPDITVDLSLSDELVDLVADGYDAAFRIGQLPDSGLVAQPLQPYRMMVAAAAYLARKGVPRVSADLAAHDCLGFAMAQG